MFLSPGRGTDAAIEVAWFCDRSVSRTRIITAMPLIGVVNADGADRAVGVAQYAANADADSCEFPIVIPDDW